MFAFPVMYPAAFFAAAGLPLLFIIGLTLFWASGSVTREDPVLFWGTLVANYGLFAWLAVRCHRMVLVGPEDGREPGPGTFSLTFRYLATLTTAAVMKNVLLLGLISVALLAFGTRYTPSSGPAPTPVADDIQWILVYGKYVLLVPILYLLARCSTLLPAIALGHEWAPGTAWRQTRGNGWRLLLVVFLLPWGLDAAVDWAYVNTEAAWFIGLLAVTTEIFTALGIIALSLSYRELPPWPAPPPTPPPS